MLSIEATGKTIEKAIENALLELKAPREDVDIKIISEGGLFKKAKVEVSISQDCVEKYTKREARRKIIADEVESQDEIIKNANEKEERSRVKQDMPQKSEKKEAAKSSRNIEENKAQKIDKKEIDAKEKKGDKEDTKPTAKVLDPEEFLIGYFKALGKDVTISTTEDDKYKTYSVVGDDLGEAIGHRGEAYYALTTIFQTVTGKQDKKYLLDIDNYRVKREESLASTAKRIADKVAKSGRYYKLEPMRPAERRIIHTALQDDDRVTTLSKGSEPHRFVIVFPKEYKDK